MSSHTLKIQDIEKTRRYYKNLGTMFVIIRGAILAGLVASFWAYLRPDQGIEQLLLAAVVLSISGWIAIDKGEPPFSQQDLKVALDIKHQSRTLNPYDDSYETSEWQTLLRDELASFRKSKRSQLLILSTTAVPLIFLFFGLLVFAPQGVSTAFSNATRVVANLTTGASLTIVEGKTKEDTPDSFSLSKSNVTEISLTSENLLEIQVVRPLVKEDAITVELRKVVNGKEELYQSFQLNAEEAGQDRNSSSSKLSFAVPESLKLYIPTISSSALAVLSVEQLPYPSVEISTQADLNEPWADDQPLKIDIRAHGEHPLRLVRLVIVSGKRRSEEMVSNILANDMHDLDTSYDLILTPYVESDIADVEIYAEAADRSIPKPLMGRSNSILLKTSSAYGRYRQTLQTLREVKTIADESVQQNRATLDVKALDLIATAEKQSERSPFFDGLDRVGISGFKQDITNIIAAQNLEKLGELSERLNQFLFEHEMLDDRERDRDFFVALRTYSRILEKDPQDRAVELNKITQRMLYFLDDRHKRWEIRAKRLEDGHTPKQWAHIRDKKPFHTNLRKVDVLDQTNDLQQRSNALALLGQTSSEYRGWLEELEKNEDSARQQAEKKRQEGLTSARNVLRELQQRQAEISQSLDRAESRPPMEFEENWPAIRSKQNGNINETKQLEAQLRVLAPSASERIQLALEAMGLNISSGGEGRWAQAESASDLAGRLLRQAESAAQKSQQNGTHQRPRRYTPSDSQFGTVIVGDVEIPHDYEVDARYREKILNEAEETLRGTDKGSDDKRLLDQYLRQIIR